MAAPRHPLRSHIITLFRRGDLVSVAEAVLICDASRQAISKWIKTAGINIDANRLAFITRHRTRAQMIAERKAPRGKPSKAQMRKMIADAMALTARKQRGKKNG